MTEKYERILSHPHHVSAERKRMSLHDRAAQFAPFAALTGFEASVEEEARLTEARIELDEYEIERLDRKLELLREQVSEASFAITYFIPDGRKKGGAYVTKKGAVKRIDEYERRLVVEDGTVIPIDDIINIEEVFL